MNAVPIPSPSAEQVDALHTLFCAEIRRLFERYKSERPGFANRRLYFDGEDAAEDEALVEERNERRALEQFHVFPARL